MHWPDYHTNVFIPQIKKQHSNLLGFVVYYFSLGKIPKTLLQPWKNITVDYLGLKNPSILERISLNIISRGIGLFLKTIVFILGICTYLAASIFVVIRNLIVRLFPILSIQAYNKWKQEPRIELYDSWDTLVSELETSTWWQFFKKRTQTTDTPIFANLLNNQVSAEVLSTRLSESIGSQFFPDLTLLLCDFNEDFKAYIDSLNLTKQDIERLSDWYTHRIHSIQPSRTWDGLYAMLPLTEQWNYGYTPHLDAFCRPVTLTAQEYETLVYAEETLTQIETTLLRKDQPHLILYGPDGAGKHSVIKSFANTIRTTIDKPFSHFRILLFDPEAFFDQQSSHNKEVQLANIIKEASRAQNVILVIEDFHKLISPKIVNFSAIEILNKTLSQYRLPIIGLTTDQAFQKQIIPLKSLQKLFSTIEVHEPSQNLTMEICYLHTLKLEDSNQIIVTYQALLEIYNLTKTYVSDDVFPEKALDILALLPGYTQAHSIKVVTADSIQQIVSQQTGISIGTHSQNDLDKTLNIDSLLKERIKGQDQAIEQIAKALRRTKSLVADTERPIGSFLFLGPTGVGKTATAQALSKIYFESDELIRLDMAEFQTAQSLTKIIGDEDTLGVLAEAIKQHPFGVLLLDEFEKANAQIHNLFLTVLDEGYLTTANNTKIDCTNLIIIATSNAAALELQKMSLEQSQQGDRYEAMIEVLLGKGHFSPELLNRFDRVIFYNTLEYPQIVEVIEIKLTQLKNRLFEQKHISLSWDKALVEVIYQKGYNVTFGIRSIEHFIVDTIEDFISTKLLTTPTIKEIDLSVLTEMLSQA